MATAYNGMNTGGNNKSSTSQTLNNDDEEEEVQQIIDIALIEMNNGNYNKAIALLEDAKRLYASSRAEELQNLIAQLRAISFESNKTERNETKASSMRERKNAYSYENEPKSEFTNDQLNMVKRISNCKNYYEVLSVSHNASEKEIKKAYKKLALCLHPDKNHAPGASEAFKILRNAVTTLTDIKKRREYDLFNTQNGNSTYSHKCPDQQNYSHRQDCHHYSSSECSFCGGEDFTAEELFYMFLRNNSTSQTYYRRRPYQSANQRQPQEERQSPSLVFGLLVVMIIISMFVSYFSPDPLYSLSHSSKYKVRHQTQHLSVPYYVKENFASDYQGSLARLEKSVEEDYVYIMKQLCFRERSYREAMMARARSFGSRAQFAQAQGIKMPSCENLYKIGI